MAASRPNKCTNALAGQSIPNTSSASSPARKRKISLNGSKSSLACQMGNLPLWGPCQFAGGRSNTLLCGGETSSQSARCRWMAAASSPPEFGQGFQKRGLRPFVLPPRSPKLKGMVERAQHIHTEEFHEVFHCSLELAGLNRELLRPLGQDVRGDAGARHRSSTPSTTSRTASRASMRL